MRAGHARSAYWVGPLLGALAQAATAWAAEAESDPGWRSPWTVSISGGALQGGWSRPASCGDPPEGATVDACAHSWTAFGIEVALPWTVARSPDGRRAFEFGPQVALQAFTGKGLFAGEQIPTSPNLKYGGGLVAGLRLLPRSPPEPGGRARFEHGFRLGTLLSQGYAGLVVSTSVEAWTAWSLAPRWRPAAPAGLPPEPVRSRRTAVVLGPYLRGLLRSYGLDASDGAAEVGLRVDVRREAAVPQPPG